MNVIRNLSYLIPDRIYLTYKFRKYLGKRIDWDNPITFSEKMQWLKLYNRNPIYTEMVDKIKAKEYVANRISEEIIIPTIGIYSKFDEIDIHKLPDQFVIKCSHDSGGTVICRNKKNFNLEYAKNKIDKCLNQNFYYVGREWPYKNIRPKILIEQYMENAECEDLRDYKIFCFNGKPMFCQVISDRTKEECVDFFDLEWNLMEFTGLSSPHFPHFPQEVIRPMKFDKMIEYAEILSKDIPFLRVDFYEIKGCIYFGEMTFYPASGFGQFYPEKWNYRIGEMLQLPIKRKNDI